MASEAHSFLTSVATVLRRENAAISRMDTALVERDIAVRRREAALGRRWAGVRSRIRKELERLGSLKPVGAEKDSAATTGRCGEVTGSVGGAESPVFAFSIRRG
jgi:hypothetical protein